MSANSETEKVLRQLHVLLSKSEPYNKDPNKVVVEKQQVLDLLSELNTCIYSIMDEYELTQRSRDRAEREFRKHGDQIVWDASRKAEDIYAASVMYTDEALNRVWEVMHETSEQMQQLCDNMQEKLKNQEKMVKTNQLELKSQLQDLRDTEKYLSLIDERNREIQRQKETGKPAYSKPEKSIYANRQSEVKVNTEYLERLGLALEEEAEEEEASVAQEAKAENENQVQSEAAVTASVKDKKEMTPEELAIEEKLRADLDADYFQWKEEDEQEKTNEKSDLSEGISKMWKSIKGSKK